jgi:ribosomal protein L37E
MKTLPCTVCGAESYERKEGNKSIFSCPYGHQKASSIEEWNDAYANKMIRQLTERVDILESELDVARMALDQQNRHIRERDEARNMVRKLLDPDWLVLGIEKKAYRLMQEWGYGVKT